MLEVELAWLEYILLNRLLHSQSLIEEGLYPVSDTRVPTEVNRAEGAGAAHGDTYLRDHVLCQTCACQVQVL